MYLGRYWLDWLGQGLNLKAGGVRRRRDIRRDDAHLRSGGTLCIACKRAPKGESAARAPSTYSYGANMRLAGASHNIK